MKSIPGILSGLFVRPLLTAVRTLTVIPLPGRDADPFSRSLLFFPITGILLGICALAVIKGTELLPADVPALRASLLLLFLTLLTGALHLDGLADTADGFWGGRTPEQRLEIMKDPRQGTFGVAAIVFDLGLKGILYAWLLDARAWAIPASLVISRSLQPLALVFVPYARKEGGTAAPFSGPGGRGWALAGFVGILSFTLLAHKDLPVGICWLAGGIAAILTAFYSYRKIKGITGDSVGAINEMVELSVLLVMI